MGYDDDVTWISIYEAAKGSTRALWSAARMLHDVFNLWHLLLNDYVADTEWAKHLEAHFPNKLAVQPQPAGVLTCNELATCNEMA